MIVDDVAGGQGRFRQDSRVWEACSTGLAQYSSPWGENEVNPEGETEGGVYFLEQENTERQGLSQGRAMSSSF